MISEIQKLLEGKLPKVGSTLFIAVDGHGGSGKTTFAKLLAEKLGAEVITQDDFASWDNPLNWWPQVIEKVFEPIKQGARTISYPRSSWAPDHHPEPVVDKPVTPIMILEGVSSLRKEFRDYISFGIFIDAPDELCQERGMQRDLSYGKSPEEVEKEWHDWLKDENEYFARDNPKEYADVVVDGTKPFDCN